MGHSQLGWERWGHPADTITKIGCEFHSVHRSKIVGHPLQFAPLEIEVFNLKSGMALRYSSSDGPAGILSPNHMLAVGKKKRRKDGHAPNPKMELLFGV